MKTTVSSKTREVTIAEDRPTVLIGERINPTGKKRLSAALQSGDMELVRKEAIAQVEAGADILDINVGAPGLDEAAILPLAVQVVMETVDVPLCIDSDNAHALEESLKVYRGKPIINSVNAQDQRLKQILPLVKDYGAAVIGLAMDDQGIPHDADRRVAIADTIISKAHALGIPVDDIIIDCLALTVATDTGAVLATLEAVRRVRDEFGVNQTLGASNVSFGLPDRSLLTSAFLTLAMAAGVTCPVVDAAKARPAVLATDLLLGRDPYAGRYISAYRLRQKG